MLRTESLNTATTEKHFDVVIIGGGIHGATLAHICAVSGIKTLLLEKIDFAFGTSSRSSKMAHGGLRYLELFDFQQVFEGIKAREKLFDDFPYLVRPHRFAVPVLRGDWWFRLKLSIGLHLYDLMTKKKERKHSWIPKTDLTTTGFSGTNLSLEGCFLYTDGLMHDARLVIERILSAKEAGATCLNYASVTTITNESAHALVEWQDVKSGQQHSIKAQMVFNCAGPWAPFLHDIHPRDENFPVRYSRGVHLLFKERWQGPSLFLPMEGKARYYWIWPHPAGTMVGTTEAETDNIDEDPAPTEAEIEEVLMRLKKDLPDGSLTVDTLHYAFAGVRTLPLREAKGAKTAQLSRKHIWKTTRRVRTLYGGKFTTAEWTAYEAAEMAAAELNRPLAPANTLAPAVNDTAIEQWKNEAKSTGISAERIALLLGRYGYRTPDVFSKPSDFQALTPEVLEGEVRFAVETEQAASISDVMRRRLELEYLPGGGLESLKAITHFLHTHYPEHVSCQTEDCATYKNTLERVYSLIAKMRR
jgi:glycerol-3-phosphate dehydrogenase